MPSNDIGVQMSGWKYGIPIFEPGALFTYFTDLKKHKYNNSDKGYAAKLELYNAASAYASSASASLKRAMDDNTRINNALTFLLLAAKSE